MQVKEQMLIISPRKELQLKDDPSLRGQGVSTPPQTAWALIGLLDAGQATGEFPAEAIQRGIAYLVAN